MVDKQTIKKSSGLIRPTLSVGIVCIIAIATFVVTLQRSDEAASQTRAETELATFEDDLANRVSHAVEYLDELHRFYRASQQVDRTEFKIFTARPSKMDGEVLAGYFPLLGFLGTSEGGEGSFYRRNNAIVREFDAADLGRAFSQAIAEAGSAVLRRHVIPDKAFPEQPLPRRSDLMITMISTLTNAQGEPAFPHRGFVFGALNVTEMLRRSISEHENMRLVAADFVTHGRTYAAFRSDGSSPTTEEVRQILISAGDLQFRMSLLPANRTSFGSTLETHMSELLAMILFALVIVGVIWQAEIRSVARAKAQEAAEKSNAMKSRFLATMSHEIRTPLNGILGMSDLVQKGQLSDRQRQHLITLNKSAEALLGIINEILDFSKIESEKIEIHLDETDVAEIVDQVVKNANVIATAKGVDVRLDYPIDVPRLLVTDGTRLRQILTNLMSNAVKFTSEGYVSLCVSVQKGTGKDGFETLSFAVKDTGIGIPEDKVETIFKPFQQADSSTTRDYGGTGLGLAITEQLSGLLGGKIVVSSRPGEGSTFEASIRAKVLPEPREKRREMAIALSLRYLVLADSEAMRRVTTATLASMGGDVEAVASIDEALEFIDRTAGTNKAFDVVLVDMEALSKGAATRFEPALGAAAPVLIEMRSSRQAHLARESSIADGIAAAISHPILPEHLALRLARVFRSSISQASGAVVSEQVPEAAAPLGPELDGVRVLLVEDDRVNQMYAEEMLESFGCIPTTCGNGEIALEKFAECDPDIVLMDCQMPVMDGFTAATALRSDFEDGSKRRVPILALTANAVRGDRQRCLDAGMDDYLTKPVREADLRKAIVRWTGASEKIERPASLQAARTNQPQEQEPTPAPVNEATLSPVSMRPDAPNVSKERANEGTPAEAPSEAAATDETVHAQRAVPGAGVAPQVNTGEAPDPAEALPVVDLAVFQKTRDSMGPRFSQLVQIFIEDGKSYINEIIQYVAGGDYENCVRVAHTLKSTSRLLGAAKLAEEARLVEVAAKEPQMAASTLPGMIAAVERTFEETLAHLSDSRVAA